MNNISENKSKLRENLIERRKQLSAKSQAQMSKNIIKQLKPVDAFKNANNIAIYLAVRGEADPHILIDQSYKESKHYYLPVLSQNKDEGLVFAPINSNTRYKDNRFKIPEPIYSQNELISAHDLDLVIMPLLGFTKEGTRLGMGGGYYDRCFSFKNKGIRKPFLLGFAYDFQELGTITAEPWDIPLDMVATESQFIYVNNKT